MDKFNQKYTKCLPDNVKQGVESLSGISMDNVKVHYNSAKPAQLNAHAYAQGIDIHIASGQEKHLPHEAWHVVQQKQGRVRPTTMMKAKVPINDDQGLEKEADVMGARALQMKPFSLSDYKTGNSVQRKEIIQRNPLETIPEGDEESGLKLKIKPGLATIPEGDEEEDVGKLELKGVTPVSDKEDVTDVFIDLWDMIELDGWDLGAKAPSGGTSPEGAEGSATEESGATEKSKEASTQAVGKKEEEETVTDINQAGKCVEEYIDVANAVAGNGVVSNASGINTPDALLAELEKNHDIKGAECYAYLNKQIPGIDKLKEFTLSDNFVEANRYIALIAVLKDSAQLVGLIKARMAKGENLSDEEKNSVNALLSSDIRSKVLDIVQGTAYGAGSIITGITEGLGIAGAAASVVPGLGIAGSGIEFLRGGWKGKKAFERRTRLNEVMEEINALKDDEHKGLAELKSKIEPIKERVNKRIAHNGLRSLGGAAAVVGGAIAVVGAVGAVGALTAATGGGFAIAAGVIGGVLATRMLYGKIRAKKEKRQQLAEYLYKTSLQGGGTGESAKKIVKAIIGNEEYTGLKDEKLIELIAKKIKST